MGPLKTFGNRVVVGWRFRSRYKRARLNGHLWKTANCSATGRKQYIEMNALSSGTNGKTSSSYRTWQFVENMQHIIE